MGKKSKNGFIVFSISWDFTYEHLGSWVSQEASSSPTFTEREKYSFRGLLRPSLNSCFEFPSAGNNSGFCLQRETSQISLQSPAPRAGWSSFMASHRNLASGTQYLRLLQKILPIALNYRVGWHFWLSKDKLLLHLTWTSPKQQSTRLPFLRLLRRQVQNVKLQSLPRLPILLIMLWKAVLFHGWLFRKQPLFVSLRTSIFL